MKCTKCGEDAVKSFTTDVTDLGACLVIVRNVPCYKCPVCDEVIYTGDVVRKLETIVKQVQQSVNDIAVVDFVKYAA